MARKKARDGIPIEWAIAQLGFQPGLLNYLKKTPYEELVPSQQVVIDEIYRIAIEGSKKYMGQLDASTKGGKATKETIKESTESRNEAIKNKALEHLKNGRDYRELSGLLAPIFDLTQRQIRTILKEMGIKKEVQ